MPQDPKPDTQTSEDLWRQIETTCTAAIRLSQDLTTHLQRGARADEFVPLLRRELELTDQIRIDIHQLGRHSAPVDAPRRDRLARNMRLLLDLEDQNHRLLTRKGVRLNNPSLTHRHRRHPQPSSGTV